MNEWRVFHFLFFFGFADPELFLDSDRLLTFSLGSCLGSPEFDVDVEKVERGAIGTGWTHFGLGLRSGS